MYNAEKHEEIKTLEAGILVEGVITQLKDGTPKDFVSEKGLEKWDKQDKLVIEIVAECKHDAKSHTDKKIFSYSTNEEGATTYSTRSNLGQYQKYYKKLPCVGDKVQMKTDGDGFFKLVFE